MSIYRNYPADIELTESYAQHVEAMTAEGLHDKADIAAELAWRDEQIKSLEFQLRRELTLREVAKELHRAALERIEKLQESGVGLP